MEYLYKKFRNKVVSEVRKSKNKYYAEYFAKHKTNMKMLWSGIRSIINSKLNIGSSISCLTHNGVEVDDSKQMANIFNNVFVNTAKKINENIPRTRKSPLDYLSFQNESSFFISPASPEEIKASINSLKSGKAVGPHSIPIYLLKILSEYIAVPLCDIVNESFSSGILPDMMKLAKVIPLYKKNSPEVPSNYRPISLLSIFSKIMEKLMHKRLYSFLEKYDILHSLQFGFRTKHSTLHALISLTESVKQTIDEGMLGCGVFIDLQKAFDTVNHSILLQKLQHYGVRGTALNWFSSYLTDRKQYVSVNGHTSDHLKITCGVPQGSVLGPLLFLIYINDLPNVSKFLTFFLFADDTNIYFKSHDLIHLQKIMNRELRKVKKWLDANCLALNIDKTNFVIFHSPHTKLPEPIVIRFCRKRIQTEKYVKFLGVLLDENLCWKYHINELSKKLSRAIGIFYKIRHFVPYEVLKLLYYSLFHSFLSYGIAVWGFTYKSYFQKLFVLQKKIIKVMTFNKQTAHSTPIFATIQLLKIDDIRQLQLLTFVYDCLNKLAPTYFHHYFVKCSQVHSYSTRLASRGDLFLERKNTFQYGIRSIEYNGARLWNMIPSHIREASSPSVFKNNLKKYFLTQYDST